MFEDLTAFIPKLQDTQFGEWVIDKENLDKPGHPIFAPYVNYDQIVMDFEAVVYRFIDEHKEMNLTQYNRILEKANIAWGSEDMYSRNISDLDGQTVMALILCAIRAERFCTGALYGALENGIILKWLDRLHQLDEVGKA